VDAHGDEVDADGVVPAGFDGDLHLGADAVIGGDQHRITKTRRLEVEKPAETAKLGAGTWSRRRTSQRLDGLDKSVSGIDIDAVFRIRPTPPNRLLPPGHEAFPSYRLSAHKRCRAAPSTFLFAPLSQLSQTYGQLGLMRFRSFGWRQSALISAAN